MAKRDTVMKKPKDTRGALRRILKCPVYDILTLADYVMHGVRSNAAL